MPYGKTPHGSCRHGRRRRRTVPYPEPLEGRETARSACEAGYPLWVPPELRPARGVLVGLAIATLFWIVIILAVVIL
jgi:hypothetical protein